MTARWLWVLARGGLGFRCNDSRFANVLDLSKILELCLEELEKEFDHFFMEKQRDELTGACLLLGLSSHTCERRLLTKRGTHAHTHVQGMAYGQKPKLRHAKGPSGKN